MERTEEGVSLGSLLAQAAETLAAGGVINPRRAAERLMAHVLGVERYRLYVDFTRPVAPAQARRYHECVARRAAGEPLQYILGSTEFMSLPFKVSPVALIPRPETEILVETALDVLGAGARGRGRARAAGSRAAESGGPSEATWAVTQVPIPLPLVLEIGTGSGAIAVSLAHHAPRAIVYATDVSPDALRLARENAEALGLAGRVTFLEGDLYAPLEDRGLEGSFVAVVSNPPYVPTAEIADLPREVRDHEPRLALDGGEDGLATVRRLIAEAPRWLRPGGHLVFEVGAGQAPQALALLEGTSLWRSVRAVKDYTDIDRVVAAELAVGELDARPE